MSYKNSFTTFYWNTRPGEQYKVYTIVKKLSGILYYTFTATLGSAKDQILSDVPGYQTIQFQSNIQEDNLWHEEELH